LQRIPAVGMGPEDHKDEDIPCQFIRLTRKAQHRGIGRSRQREEAEQALLVWLDSTIQKLEEKLAKSDVSVRSPWSAQGSRIHLENRLKLSADFCKLIA